MCTRLVQNNNGTPSDPTDDVVAGECQTLFVPVGVERLRHRFGLRGAGERLGHLRRDPRALLQQVGGSGLGLHDGHRLHAGRRLLDAARAFPAATARPSAARRTPPASTPAVDLCAGAGSACVQRGAPDAPLHACYDGCTARGGRRRPDVHPRRIRLRRLRRTANPRASASGRPERNRRARDAIGSSRRVRLGSLAALVLCAAPLHAQQTRAAPGRGRPRRRPRRGGRRSARDGRRAARGAGGCRPPAARAARRRDRRRRRANPHQRRDARRVRSRRRGRSRRRRRAPARSGAAAARAAAGAGMRRRT